MTSGEVSNSIDEAKAREERDGRAALVSDLLIDRFLWKPIVPTILPKTPGDA
jgi:hypothetical protein